MDSDKVKIQTSHQPVHLFSLDRSITKEVLHLALPVVAGMASITAIGLTDTIMVGRLGAEALAATGQAAMIFWSIYWTLRSIEISTQALVSRRFGEANQAACGQILTNALALSLMISIPGLVLIYAAAPTIMHFISTHEAVVTYAVGYIRILVLSMWAAGFFFAMRGFFSGIGKTKIFLASAVVLFTVNLIANYAFIFGHWGAPRLEVQGAALGSAISMTCGFIFMLMFALGATGKNYRREYGLFRWSDLDWSVIKEIFRLASPNAFRGVMVIGGILVFYAMVDRLDVIQVAIVNVVLNIQSVSFMPGYGFGVAAATLIGHNLGAGNYEKAERAGYEAMKLGVLFMGSLGLIFIFVPEWAVSIFTDDPAVIENALFPLRIVGIVQIVDAAGMVFSTALEGAGNTHWVMKAEIFVNWVIFLPLTYILTFWMKLGRFGPWIAWAVYITVFGIICFRKYREGGWKEIRI